MDRSARSGTPSNIDDYVQILRLFIYASRPKRRLLLKLGASGNDTRTTRERAAPSAKLTEFMINNIIENTHNVFTRMLTRSESVPLHDRR